MNSATRVLDTTAAAACRWPRVSRAGAILERLAPLPRGRLVIEDADGARWRSATPAEREALVRRAVTDSASTAARHRRQRRRRGVLGGGQWTSPDPVAVMRCWPPTASC